MRHTCREFRPLRPDVIRIFLQKKFPFSCIYQKYFVILQRKIKNNRKMKTQQPKQMPFISENNGGGVPQKEYFTADEAMAYLEPRIRAMFR